MIAFLTQYYRGLGHAMRIKYISDCMPHNSFIIINQLFNPPLTYNTDYSYHLEENPTEELVNEYQYIINSERVRRRVNKFKSLLDQITVLVCEGFPFCRQQFAYEYLSFFEECKKRDIPIIISIRDYPWDDPHSKNIQDWVAKTIEYILDKFDCTILIHGDQEILPLMSDETQHYYGSELCANLEHRLIYTGYVCNPNIKQHEQKTNDIYISCGLNKEESFHIYGKILKSLAQRYKNYNFIVPLGNADLHTKIGNRESNNITIVNYIPDLSKKLESCALYITYGGYNSTTDILKSGIPSIIIPREIDHKLEQLIRCYTLKPLNMFKVCPCIELNYIHTYFQQILEEPTFPYKQSINLQGAEFSARYLESIS